jgi:hypothetical protein
MTRPAHSLEDDLGVLTAALTARERADGSVAARKATVTAIEAIDSMLRQLYLLRGRLVRDISTPRQQEKGS